MITVAGPILPFEHSTVLTQLARECSHVTVYSNLDDPVLAILKGSPDKLLCRVNQTDKPWLNQHTHLEVTEISPLNPEDIYSVKTNFLYTALSTSYTEVKKVLANCSNISKFLAFQHTIPFYVRGSDHRVGISNAFAEFKEEHPEWRPTYYSPKNWGLIIFTRLSDWYNPSVKWNPTKYAQEALDREDQFKVEQHKANMFKRAEEQARTHWDALHKYPIVIPIWDQLKAYNWYMAWQANIPSGSCNCKKNWIELTQSFPPDFTSRKSFFYWTIDRHNDVNLKLSKPHFSYSQAEALYGHPPI